MSKRIILVGKNSRLGRVFLDYHEWDEIICYDRYQFNEFFKHEHKDFLINYIEDSEKDTTILVAAGIMDPKHNHDDLWYTNYYLPIEIIKTLSKTNSRIITVGTMFECMQPDLNEYVKSKRALSDWIQNFDKSSCAVVNHFRLHTLYGSYRPNKQMFLGQLLNSLEKNSQFTMSTGTQLREYHNLSTVVNIIARYQNLGDRIVEISHGKPLKLIQIAERVLAHFGKSNLLNIDVNLNILAEQNIPVRAATITENDRQITTSEDILEDICDYIFRCFNGEISD